MPWQGQKDVMIDRFDGRAHLDFISEPNATNDVDEKDAERELNYERFRILVQNDFLKVNEEKFLKTIEMEEKFGSCYSAAKQAKEDKKRKSANKAAIGFNYDEDNNATATRPVPDNLRKSAVNAKVGEFNVDEDQSDSDLSDVDFDITVDVSGLGHESKREINHAAKAFNIAKDDFVKFLTRDIKEQEILKAERKREEEKAAMSSGRKSRRERRIIRERRLLQRAINVPIYAESSEVKREKTPKSESESDDDDDDCDNVNNGKVEFITSFGGDEEDGEKTLEEERRKRRDRWRKRPDRDKHHHRVEFGPTLPSNHSKRSVLTFAIRKSIMRT